MVTRIEEQRVEGKRTGRHVSSVDLGVFDHLLESKLPHVDLRKKPVTKDWNRRFPVLDQGNLGSCTGNGSLGVRGSDPFYDKATVDGDKTPTWSEETAVSIYSLATHLDGGGADQYYPPNDDGATVLGAMKALKQLGYVKGYAWGFNMHPVLSALSQYGPVAFGFNWYDSFDSPNSSGRVSISPNASVRGGHCWECDGVDVEAKVVWCTNSWGTGWGLEGTFCFSFDDLERLIHESGEVATVVI